MTIPEIIDAHSDDIDYYIDLILNNTSSFNNDYGEERSIRFGFSNGAEWDTLMRSCLSDLDDNDKYQFYKALKDKILTSVISKVNNRFLPVESESMFYHIGQGLMNAMFLIKDIHVCDCRCDMQGIVDVDVIIDYSIRVYDCGSGTKPVIPSNKICVLNDFAYDCRGFLYRSLSDPKPLVEYLYISHFHTDHINGIGELSQHCDVQNVMLAYADGSQKVMSILDRMTRDEENENSTFDIASCQQEMFPENTIADMFRNQNMDVNLIILHKSDNIDLQNMISLKLNEVKDNSEQKLLYDPAQSYDIHNGTNTIHVYHAYPDPEACNSNVKASHYFEETKSWKMLVMNYVPAGKEYDNIHERFLADLHARFDDIPESDNDPMWSAKVFEHLIDKDGRAAIKNIYENLGISSDLNQTSLCLAVSPKNYVASQTKDYVVASTSQYGNYYLNDCSIVCPTILLLGDSVLFAQFENNKQFYKVILDTLNTYNFPKIKAALLPHHGSINNISQESFYDISTWKAQENEPFFWIVSYGKNNTFGHPNQPPCDCIGAHKCVQYNKDAKSETFPKLKSEKIEDVLLTDDGGEELINNFVLFHCHDNSKTFVRIYHAILNN